MSILRTIAMFIYLFGYMILHYGILRRAERAALRADEKYGTDAEALMFLTRLSDYFYALGRMLTAHYEVDETLWIP